MTWPNESVRKGGRPAGVSMLCTGREQDGNEGQSRSASFETTRERTRARCSR